ncbi:MAG: molybdopterin molybdotransferase MoeA [Desulfobulbaceae bacterium]|jgi:molybdopterin molybdotransferase|nr:molybdopterin molybdotransferase MoeA [Desulfobulbaceae bacterium]
MISIEEALHIVEANIPERRVVDIDLREAQGLHLAQDIRAPESSPRYTGSSMDGYALRFADCRGASADNPVFLKIVGESQAGIPFVGEVNAGCATRISTGAMLPVGCDTVLRVEDSREDGDRLAVLYAPTLSQDVRLAGEEFAVGEVLLRQGAALQARELALLAAVGVGRVTVFAMPRVAILVTGTELARHDEAVIQPHQIRDSNSLMLAAAARQSGGEVIARERVADSPDATRAAIAQANAAGVEIILCSGGVSVGRHDHVKEAALAEGFSQLFWKVRQKPGKPLFVCRKNNTLLFGLPGNPVSAYMCFCKYVAPALAHLAGRRRDERLVTGVADGRFTNDDNRTHLTRVRLTWRESQPPLVSQLDRQGAHMLTGLVMADGFVTLEPGCEIASGAMLEVHLL